MILLSGSVIGFYKALIIPILLLVSAILYGLFRVLNKTQIYREVIKDSGIVIKVILGILAIPAIIILVIVIGSLFALILSA